ncbi:MAG: hypothetical protein KA239_06655 [Bacteroidia bacterium]|jgi:hypothetical protein|nr:hypothetical protein [Bacteroidia bacterium]
MHFIVSILIAMSVASWVQPGGGNDQYGISKGTPEITLHLKQPLVSGNSVKLGYEIPYAGYIEFHLFDATGTQIWVDYGVRDKGEHVQALRADKLTAGQVYNYEFWYKGKPYPGKFNV